MGLFRWLLGKKDAPASPATPEMKNLLRNPIRVKGNILVYGVGNPTPPTQDAVLGLFQQLPVETRKMLVGRCEITCMSVSQAVAYAKACQFAGAEKDVMLAVEYAVVIDAMKKAEKEPCPPGHAATAFMLWKSRQEDLPNFTSLWVPVWHPQAK